MSTNRNDLIKEITRMKEENERLEQLINFQRMENFEYALKCNRLKNALANVRSVVKRMPAAMLGSSDAICNILQGTGASETQVLQETINFKRASEGERKFNRSIAQSSQKTQSSNKAHVVNPHMVNGHVLYVPTINLTRVSPNKKKSNCENETISGVADLSSIDPNDNSQSNSFSENGDGEGSNDSHNNHQLTRIEEISEPLPSTSSKSPSHSTVLSGTFQEVKIYLNPISSETERPSEQPKKSAKKVKQSRSPVRASSSFSSVTKRKKS